VDSVAEEIARLERERHERSMTFANTAPDDPVTRAHLQHEMDWRTRRISELQAQQPLGFVARWGLRTAAALLTWGAWETPWTWAKVTLGVLAVVVAFFSLS
jgi:hypothetical protein